MEDTLVTLRSGFRIRRHAGQIKEGGVLTFGLPLVRGLATEGLGLSENLCSGRLRLPFNQDFNDRISEVLEFDRPLVKSSIIVTSQFGLKERTKL